MAELPDSSKTNSEILIKLEGHFREAVRDQSWRDFLTNAVKVSDYKENNQWTADEIKELVEVRKQPLYINNQVKVTIDFLNGCVLFRTLCSTVTPLLPSLLGWGVPKACIC